MEKAWAPYKDFVPPSGGITGKIEIDIEKIKQFQKEIKNLEIFKQKIIEVPAIDPSKLVELTIVGALATDSSDIHLEPKEEKVTLRYRIDGVLHDVAFLFPNIYKYILSRIKLLSEMQLNIYDIPQDGRFTIKIGQNDIEVRVSVVPGAYGENIVMRVLNPQAIKLNLEDLGLRKSSLEIIEREIEKPHGMILTTGPTGSGKTTTLYACLKKLADPTIKIITLEDPIEYHLGNIAQTQVEEKRGYTFSKGLRAILRQDPDVVLVGEIRDRDTAETALQASLTGHLVFSTLHTNDAAGAVPRFTELGAKAPILASALTLIIAQRLVRKICLKCKVAFSPSAKQFTQIKKALEGLPQEIERPALNQNLKIHKAKGCLQCNQTGYKGRIGVFEIIIVEDEMEKLISVSPSHAQILAFTQKQGSMTMYQDAVLKVLEGITALEEVERIVGQ
ncbi:MAG: hypothetical protein A3A94_00290 [Candidatus Portnoybacteria bacterium RIFCSPLOWO2_01_FULL_43_11]|uniref:Bacterial type II secretion system protein E domain-containing protein n=4 Tax=Candidatus Portnoyibacteriota TaxID=1817913 RepID=A0A1G2FDD0_9BACT|nr:MAG: hypothetical protein A2815_00050 [Candidatus Portnoybacteria bacterium RIFCSPHIGHO2_01_FULL_40_12b]OGZ37446.1 MAG: hypothetical protein A3D38_02310 [Candidatus Portnoybacteria bacterium RIFCSPHIGHO2_02_FULL_40_23]OGZ37979.1 MAG: hypothetical protein A3E90_02455 [Candidatus Portnoybacteria bacterium RIFCSPHIGHO2_12_FULL_40_11]OGZ38182.1 MAG: hypothetical protein A3A94_00290 [Candidatus Portnoybacteria bacterium RIFCSPLOWO2_01_FULL_43_11]OGZ40351.1 MAG: hypothetical protein A3I20_00165 [C